MFYEFDSLTVEFPEVTLEELEERVVTSNVTMTFKTADYPHLVWLMDMLEKRHTTTLDHLDGSWLWG